MIPVWADRGQLIAPGRFFLTDPRLILCGFAALISLVVAISSMGGIRRMTWRSRPVPVLKRLVRLSVIIPARDEEQEPRPRHLVRCSLRRMSSLR